MNERNSRRSDRILITTVMIPWFLIYIPGALLARSASAPYELSVVILALSAVIPCSYSLLSILSRPAKNSWLVCIVLAVISAGTAYAVYVHGLWGVG